MLQWFTENWYIGIAMIILLLIALFALNRLSSSNNKIISDREKKLKKLHELRGSFENMTEETFDSQSDEFLLDGVALHYQLKLQKEDDMNTAFLLLPTPAKYIYALNIFYFEGGTLSSFYHLNGEPLSSQLAPAFKAIGEDEIALSAEKMFDMYDETRENVSIDRKLVKELDEKVRKLYNEGAFKLKVAKYLRGNKNAFFE